MAIYAQTLDNIVETTCKLVDDWTEGVVTGTPAAGYINDATNRFEADDYWNNKGAYLYIRTGGATGDWRKITAFANTGAKITVGANFSATPAAGDTYSIHVAYPRDEVVEMINLAINMVAEEALVWLVDESTITLVADTYEYNLPTSFMFLHKVTMADSDGDFYGNPIPPDHYKIVHSTTPKIHFIQLPSDQQFEGHSYGSLWRNSGFTSGRALRLEGLGSPDVLSTDSDACPISPAYVAFQAASLLHAKRIRRPENDPDEHRVQTVIWQARADIERLRVVKVQLPPNAKRVRE